MQSKIDSIKASKPEILLKYTHSTFYYRFTKATSSECLFRKIGYWNIEKVTSVNSPKEFQAVTQVSDSLL
jgi:hypothetical protein